MSPSDPAPDLTEVRRLPGLRRLRLTWSDGHTLELEYDVLRGWCPCAACQGHENVERRFHPPAAPVTPNRIEPVGHYAISILWSDGHGTGIYRYDYLRKLGELEESRGSA